MENHHRPWQFDKSINLANLAAIVLMIITIAKYGAEAIGYLQALDNKVSIMWVDFARQHPEAVEQLNAIQHKEK